MGAQSLQLTLDAFQGPFDLLLHLIKENDIDINDIPMTEITSQYLAYIDAQTDISLDQMGDYLVMAATLLEIKSRILLPIEQKDSDELEEEGDLRENLVQQLLLYQQFQSVAEALSKMESSRQEMLNRPASDLSEHQELVPLVEGDLTISQLVQAYEVVLWRYQDRQPLQREVVHDTITVSEKISLITNYFDHKGSSGRALLSDFMQVNSRQEIITTFMAMLELVRKQYLLFHQDQLAGPIYLRKVAKE